MGDVQIFRRLEAEVGVDLLNFTFSHFNLLVYIHIGQGGGSGAHEESTRADGGATPWGRLALSFSFTQTKSMREEEQKSELPAHSLRVRARKRPFL